MIEHSCNYKLKKADSKDTTDDRDLGLLPTPATTSKRCV